MTHNWKPQWPKADYPTWLGPGQLATVEAECGKGLDRGAIREGVNGTEILWAEGSWIPFKPGSRGHITAANMFARLGPGWSQGGHPDTMHNIGRGYFRTVNGRDPEPMESVDVIYNERLFKDLKRAATVKDSDDNHANNDGDGDDNPIEEVNRKLDKIMSHFGIE